MATDTGYRIENLGRLTRSLEKAGAEVADLRDAMARVAEEVKPDYQGVTPRRSGALAGDYRTGKTKNKAVLYVGRASIPYAAAQNYGWGRLAQSYSHGRRAGAIRGTSPGHNYVAKGDQIATPKAARSLESELTTLLRRLDLI